MSQEQTRYPDPEVTPKAKRRRFNAEYKLRILAEVDGCTRPGEIGALLRREGLYSSHLSKWRKQRNVSIDLRQLFLEFSVEFLCLARSPFQ
jgi:transposase